MAVTKVKAPSPDCAFGLSGRVSELAGQLPDLPSSRRSVWGLWEICNINAESTVHPPLAANVPHTTDLTPNVSLEKRQLNSLPLLVVMVMSLRSGDVTEGHLGEWGAGREEKAATLLLHLPGPGPEDIFPDSPPASFPTLTALGSGDAPSFCRSSFIPNDSSSLLRSWCCLFCQVLGKVEVD